MGQRLTLAVQGKMDVVIVKINGYDDDDDCENYNATGCERTPVVFVTE